MGKLKIVPGLVQEALCEKGSPMKQNEKNLRINKTWLNRTKKGWEMRKNCTKTYR